MASAYDVTPSPSDDRPSTTNQSTLNDILHDLQGGMSRKKSPNNAAMITISTEQFQTSLQKLQEQTDIIANLQQKTFFNQSASPSNHPSHASSNLTGMPEYYNNAKYEDVIFRPIKPIYDGSPEQLVPFLNRLDIRRQDEGWYPITFLKIGDHGYDITRHFTKLDESVMLQEVKMRWSSLNVGHEKHTVDYPTYNARVLGHLLLHSIMDDFSTTIINRIPTEY
jgi:hypothetical protein